MKFRSLRSAFSLTELSVVVLVSSFVLVGILSVQTSGNSTNKVKVTNDRIGQNYRALKVYAGVNKKLPCPASIAAAKNDPAYGSEGSCAAGSGVYVSGTLVYGMLPVKALDLPTSLAEDDYGNKLIYIVDSTFTTATTPSKFVDQEGSIVVKRYTSSLTTEEPNAIFAIISRGKNQRGAVAANATTEINAPTDVDELENMSTGFDANLISGTNRSATTFDDLVFFKNKKYFLADADLTALQDQNLVGCTSGYTRVAGDCVVQCDVPTTTGINSGSKVNQGTNQSLFCNAPNFNTSDSINYNCSASREFTRNSGSCTCATGYTASGSSCVAITCAPPTITGIDWSGVTSLSYDTGNKQCSGANFDTTKSINYDCGSSGFSITSGSCTCNSGYSISGAACVLAPLNCSSGGSISVVSGRRVHIFTTSDSLVCNGGATSDLDILVVGGGGSGGKGFSNSNGSTQAGGGGGGQIKESLNNSVSGVSSFTVTVGGGGSPSPSPPLAGSPSSIAGGSISIAANGGGRGGGSGGGATAVTSPSPSGLGGGGSGSSSLGAPGASGNANGGNGAQASRYAGGGASNNSAGVTANSNLIGSGGAGVISSVSGAAVTYGGGGGGAGANGVSGGLGGSGGGGRGARYASISRPTSFPAESGTNGLGGGGGGGSGDQVTPGAGGNGVVVVSYPN